MRAACAAVMSTRLKLLLLNIWLGKWWEMLRTEYIICIQTVSVSGKRPSVPGLWTLKRVVANGWRNSPRFRNAWYDRAGLAGQLGNLQAEISRWMWEYVKEKFKNNLRFAGWRAVNLKSQRHDSGRICSPALATTGETYWTQTTWNLKFKRTSLD